MNPALRNGLLLAAALACSEGFAPSPVMAVAKEPCQRKGSTIVKASRYPVVLRLRDRTYGCLLSRDRLVSFGELRSFSYTEKVEGAVAVSGRWAVAGIRKTSKERSYTVRMIDLNGRHGALDVNPAHGEEYEGAPDFDGLVFTALRLTARGQIAWIARNPNAPGRVLDVRTFRRGELGSTLVARGSDINPTRLGLLDSQVTWEQAGQRRTRRPGLPAGVS